MVSAEAVGISGFSVQPQHDAAREEKTLVKLVCLAMKQALDCQIGMWFKEAQAVYKMSNWPCESEFAGVLSYMLVWKCGRVV